MGYFQVRYDSRVLIYNRTAFIRLTTVFVFLGYAWWSYILHL